MKTEITLDNKERFFAQYYDQTVLWNANGDKKVMPTTNWCTVQNYGKFNDWACLLKPLSSISDEDFTQIMWKQFPFQPNFKIGKIYHEHLNINQADYLRSKSYALPWMGLSVEELVEAGWIKLTN